MEYRERITRCRREEFEERVHIARIPVAVATTLVNNFFNEDMALDT